MPNDLGEVTANYPVGALTKGKKLENEENGGTATDTLDFMLKQFRQDYIANADTAPSEIQRSQEPPPAKEPPTSRGPLDILTDLPSIVLVIFSLGAGGGVALVIVVLAILALRYIP
jgi:hypothetical protein